MNFFKNCETVQEIKSLFRELAFKYHPDHGGTDRRFPRN
jgi:curved DNA-binding protein CbpA